MVWIEPAGAAMANQPANMFNPYMFWFRDTPAESKIRNTVLLQTFYTQNADGFHGCEILAENTSIKQAAWQAPPNSLQGKRHTKKQHEPHVYDADGPAVSSETKPGRGGKQFQSLALVAGTKFGLGQEKVPKIPAI